MNRVFYILICIISVVAADRVVMTNNGPIQGVTVSTGERTVEAFLGIPYAEPPVGQLRFRRPVPKKPWSGVYSAIRQPPSCMQNVSNHYFEPNIENMSEDCLYLNVWVPYSENSTNLKPIMLFVHGGAFKIGSINMPLYDGTKMAHSGDIIVVTLNYRLGAFGFLLAYIEEADSNMGIFDQILAMKWIKDNAKTFGGNPEHIVLIGESAGSMIIGGHLSSPLTQNLFKRAIMQSGTAMMPMGLDNNTWLFQNSHKLVSLAGCADKTVTLKDDPHRVVECLKRLPAQAIVDAETRMGAVNPLTFIPRMNSDYLPQPAIHLVKQGIFKDTELLIGTSVAEGDLVLTAAVPDYFGVYGVNRIASMSKRIAYQLLRFIFKVVGVRADKEVADFYIGSIQNGTTEDYVRGISNAIGDYYVTCNTYYHAEFYSIRNPVYYYVLTRRPSSTPLAEWMQATHFDELQYVFGNPLFQNFTPEEQDFSNRIMARWVSFAKTGNPNLPGLVEWPAFTREDQKYLNLNDQETVYSRPENRRCEFWREAHDAVIDDNVVSRIKGYASAGSAVATDILQTTSSFLLTTIGYREQ